MSLKRLQGAIQRFGTMRQKTIVIPGSERGQARTASVVSRGRRYLLITILLSVGVHLFAAFLIVSLPRLLPTDARPVEQGTVELLMIEQKGTRQNQVEHKSTQVTPKNVVAPEAEPQASAPSTEPAPPVSEDAYKPASSVSKDPPPEAASVDANQEQAKQQPRPSDLQQAPIFNLEGTESESNAIALGSQILPAMPDNRFRNRPPVYPAEAEMHGQHGAVVVMIHVTENGIATGADVMESSGVDILDQAAIAAVRKWRFHPAMRAGSPVPFDMPFRFIFEPY